MSVNYNPALFRDKRQKYPSPSEVIEASQNPALADHPANILGLSNAPMSALADLVARHQEMTSGSSSTPMPKTKADVNGHLVNDHEYTEEGAGSTVPPSKDELHRQHHWLHAHGHADHEHAEG